MKKFLSFIDKNKYFFITLLFSVLSGYLRYDSDKGLNDFRLSQFLPDYSLGYCSRFLIGSVLAVFKKSFTEQWLTVFSECVFVFTCFLTAVLFNELIKRTGVEYRNGVAVMGLFIISMTMGYGFFTYWLGMLDIFWYIFTLLALVCLCNKYLRWLFPVFSFLCLANHYMAALFIFPVFAAVLMFQASENPKDKKTAALLILTVAVSVLSGIYFVFLGPKTVTVTPEQAQNYLNAKLPVDQRHILFYMFGKARYDYVSTFSGVIKTNIEENIGYLEPHLIIALFAAALPVVAVFTYIYIQAFKKSKNVFGKITSVLCIAFNALPFLIIIASSDYVRWFAMTFISQALIIFYLVFKNNEGICYGFGRTVAFFRKNPLLLAALGYISIIYASRF